MDALPRGINRRVEIEVDESLRGRFSARVLRQGPEACWPWVGGLRNGYGALKNNNHVVSAHVVAFVLASGPVPAGCIVCHTCDNRVCCNPAHLYAGTPGDNVRDADRRRAIPRPHGSQVRTSVLTEREVLVALALRIVLRWGAIRISRELGHAINTIAHVIKREHWKHVPLPTVEEATRIVHDWRRNGSRPGGPEACSQE
jgi:hypothetical protein